MKRNKNISSISATSPASARILVLVAAFVLFQITSVYSQVMTNTSATVTMTSGVVVGTMDAYNISGGTLVNNGTFNMLRHYTSTGITSGDGLYTLGGNWTNTGGFFVPGSSTVVFNGTTNQFITRAGGEAFNNLSVLNSGPDPTNRIGIANNVEVKGVLTMTVGNIDAGTWILYISNPLAAALNYNSTTGSRILGKFERKLSEITGTYLFPLGTSVYYNPLNLKPNSLSGTGSLLSQFITSPVPGNTGLPLPDPPVEIADTYQSGYWSLTANSLTVSNFNINLNATGFTDAVINTTRLLKRTTGGPWIVDGTHQTADTVNSVVYRNTLITGISTSGTQFALGRARPLILDHPHDTIFCERTNPVFRVIATGAQALRYEWYKVSAPSDILISNGAHYAGARTATLTILGAVLSDAGDYYCIVSDRYGNSTRTNNATLEVRKIPVATVSNAAQDHVCSNIDFIDMVLGLTYWDPGTRFVWTRDNPAGITSSMPMSDTKFNIGDLIEGAFDNTTDAPVKVTFIITPIGPGYTNCAGDPVTAYLMVNPTPRVVPVNVNPAICYGAFTEIQLTSPTEMTKGDITFDYTISIPGLPGEVIGTTTPANGLAKNATLKFQYWNETDTIKSVFYTILPRNLVSGCNDGPVQVPEVKLHPKPLQDLYISQPLTCAGGNDATVTVVLSRGSKPDNVFGSVPWTGEYSFNTTSNIVTITEIQGGYVFVNVRDNLGCIDSNKVFVSGASLDSYFIVNDKINGYGTTCPESTDGVISLKENLSSTGIPPFEYFIVHTEPDTIVKHGYINVKNAPLEYTYNLAPGTYRLLIFDANGCVNIDFPEREITAPEEIKIEFDPHIFNGGFNVSCKGYNDGSIKVKSITGGTDGSHTYKWTRKNGIITGPDNLDHLDNLVADTYYLTVTDIMGCVKLDSITLTEPQGMSLAGSLVSRSPDKDYNISCNGGNDGSISITIGGGSGTYNYLWSNGATSKDISGLKAGTYTCTVTDVNGCILTPNPQFTLTEPAPLVISSVSSLSPTGNYNISCTGGTGSIDVTITGGSTGNYFYDWTTTNGSGIQNGIQDQNALTAGTYHLVVRDSNNCVAVRDINLTQPPAISTTLVPTHITCAAPGFSNGSIGLTVTGGESPYAYQWSNGRTTQNVSGLTQGYYRVTVRDANGCTRTDSVRVNLPPPLEYEKTISLYGTYNISCYGFKDGSISINTTSGQPPYTFAWSGPAGFSATTSSISDLGAGTYTVLITDANLCTATESFVMTQPGKLSMNIATSSSIAGGFNINCAGDSTASIDLLPVNQVGSVRYLWSDGESSSSRYDLPAGIYDVIITDDNNCQADTTITLTQPDSLKLVFDSTQPWCPDKPNGRVRVTASGGVIGTDYLYKWSDNSGVREISNILRGEYKVIVTDLNLCEVKDSITIEPLNETCLIIPNAISPNGDLINDVWNIGERELYPQMEIRVFNRWGETIWRSEKGYPQPWDGRSNGRPLPIDSYHYIIDLHNGSKPYVGTITIVR